MEVRGCSTPSKFFVKKHAQPYIFYQNISAAVKLKRNHAAPITAAQHYITYTSQSSVVSMKLKTSKFQHTA